MSITKRLAAGTMALTDHIERSFEEKGIYVRGYSYADVAVGAIFRRSVRLASAIITLAKTGCGADALALSRSLIDCWLALRWITNQDSETRGKLFWGFGAKQKARMADM